MSPSVTVKLGALLVAGAAFAAASCTGAASPPQPAAILTATDADPGDDSGTSACAAFCALGERVACPAVAADCQQRCQAGLQGPCADPSRTLIACVLARTPGDFTCDSHGKWRLRPGLCAAEQAAVIRCGGAP